MIKGKIEGAKALEEALKLLPERTRGKLVTSAVRTGANVVKKEIKARAPVGTEPTLRKRTKKNGEVVQADYGRLRDNIKTMLKKAEKNVTISVGIGRAYWGMFLEFGTSKMAARPFIRPAFDASKEAAVKKMGDQLGKGIEREAKKLAGETKGKK